MFFIKPRLIFLKTIVPRHTGVPRIFIRNCIFARYSKKRATSYLSSLEFVTHTHTHTGSSPIVLFNICHILFSYAFHSYGECIYMQIHIYGHMRFVPPFREAKFCCVPSCVFDKLGCVAGEKRLRNTALDPRHFILRCIKRRSVF
jgi:hypothetical protein